MGFRDFRVFFFGYRAQNENLETTEYHYFGVIKMKYTWICFMITILTFWWPTLWLMVFWLAMTSLLTNQDGTEWKWNTSSTPLTLNTQFQRKPHALSKW